MSKYYFYLIPQNGEALTSVCQYERVDVAFNNAKAVAEALVRNNDELFNFRGELKALAELGQEFVEYHVIEIATKESVISDQANKSSLMEQAKKAQLGQTALLSQLYANWLKANPNVPKKSADDVLSRSYILTEKQLAWLFLFIDKAEREWQEAVDSQARKV